MDLQVFLKNFGRSLKEARRQMGLSQVAAAEKMQIDYRHYQNIEGGKINLRLDTMIKLINFYKLNPNNTPEEVSGCIQLLQSVHNKNQDDSADLASNL